MMELKHKQIFNNEVEMALNPHYIRNMLKKRANSENKQQKTPEKFDMKKIVLIA